MVVFSDVDVVLGDLSSRVVATALEMMAHEGIPLILCSGKTRAELEYIRHRFEIPHPFVCEDGAAVVVPREYFGFSVPHTRDLAGSYLVEYGEKYSVVVDALRRTAHRVAVEIRGVDDMSVDEVASEFHIPPLHARLAMLREYTECFRICDPTQSVSERLFKALRATRLRCLHGARYHHIGAPVDKRVCVMLLTALYWRHRGPVVTVGVTDGVGDQTLLRAVDRPIVIRDCEPRLMTFPAENAATTLTDASGVAGWAEAIFDLVEEHRGHRRPYALRT
jgi:mannosyl-3-phosphoglycerate phosphatase family protein